MKHGGGSPSARRSSAAAPSLHGALLAARIAAHACAPGRHPDPYRPVEGGRPDRGVDLWWSGMHHQHGGNVQVVTAPDGWPLWTSPVRPGREHDTTCAPARGGLLDALTDWTDLEHAVLADQEHPRCHADRRAAHDQRAALRYRALAERGNSLLKTTSKGLRRVTSAPGGSARSPPPHSSSCTTSTAAPPGQPATGKGSVTGLAVAADRRIHLSRVTDGSGTRCWLAERPEHEGAGRPGRPRR